MGEMPGPDLLRPRSDEDVHVISGINFLPQLDAIICSVSMIPVEFTISWLSLFSLGLSSSEMATLKTFCVVSRVRPVTPRLSSG